MLIYGGLAAFLIGTLFSLLFFAAGVWRATYTREPITGAIRDTGDMKLVPIGVGIAGIGLLALVGGLGYSLFAHGGRHRGPVRTLNRVRVVARYGINRQGAVMADWELEQDESAKTYVKLAIGPGVFEEFECAREMYYQAGEGMMGDAEIQGRWLGRFVPLIGGLPPQPGEFDRL
jgi:hypothetical protein